ncbi:MAG TPA: helicase-related protein, partial [Arenimonas sp.]|nr:helicase-related protein [Arenimonas sp.]
EADEMLRMGFIDDVEQILRSMPEQRQTALFSATMPPPVRRIAQTYLREPAEVTIAARTRTAENIRQRYWQVSGLHKLDALTRILEAEPFDAMIVFTRTKQATEELAEKLQARGFAAAAINGDVAQAQRERTIAQLKEGKVDILVATDVAARGLDVDRISHVLNYDVPYDTESYVHRIGRTGRAGRSGEAILFIAPRERGLLRAIERTTRQPIEPMDLPGVEVINDARIGKFKQRISDTLAANGLGLFQALVEEYEREHNVPAIEIAAALARLAHGDAPLLLEPPKREPKPAREFAAERGPRQRREREEYAERGERPARPAPRKERVPHTPDPGMATYRIEVGYEDGVKPGNIVGAIANEAGLEARQIGRIEIYPDHSLLDLPADLPAQVLGHLKGTWCAGRQLRITRDGEPPDTLPRAPGRKPYARKSTGPRHDGGERKPFGPKKSGPKKPHRKGPRPF